MGDGEDLNWPELFPPFQINTEILPSPPPPIRSQQPNLNPPTQPPHTDVHARVTTQHYTGSLPSREALDVCANISAYLRKALSPFLYPSWFTLPSLLCSFFSFSSSTPLSYGPRCAYCYFLCPLAYQELFFFVVRCGCYLL